MAEPRPTPLQPLSGPLDELLESLARYDPPIDSLRRLAASMEQEFAPAWCVIGIVDDDGERRLVHTSRLPDDTRAAVREFDGARLLALPPGSLQVVEGPTLAAEEALTATLERGGMASAWLLAVGAPTSGQTVAGVVLFRTSTRPPTVAELVLLRRYHNLAATIVARLQRDEQQEHDAHHDPVTGLPNRSAVVARVGTALARRGAARLAVLCVGLNRFSAVNESLGRSAGDQLLRQAGARIRSVVRPADLVGRLDGDSFAVVCEGLFSPVVAERLAERVLQVVGEPTAVEGATVAVQASIGIAYGGDADDRPDDRPPRDAPDADDAARAEVLVQHATSAARQPAPGPASYAVYRSDLRDRSVDRLELEAALRRAVEHDELVVRYQPQVDASDRRVLGVEALLRWQLDGRAVSPDVFIPVAEHSGLIGPLGRWVLSQAADAVAGWDAEVPDARLTVTVNLSAHQLADADLEASVRAVLDESQVDPSRLWLEITETALVRDPDGAAAVLDRLKGLGLGVAIDDFGTGYASLDYLRRFPMADMLKIDRTFVDGVAQPGTNDAAIIAAAVGLGRSLGMVTVAEGVETAAQAAVLAELGCDRLQGNLFGRPVPAAEIPALVRGATTGRRA